jgi:hypothetical protein
VPAPGTKINFSLRAIAQPAEIPFQLVEASVYPTWHAYPLSRSAMIDAIDHAVVMEEVPLTSWIGRTYAPQPSPSFL